MPADIPFIPGPRQYRVNVDNRQQAALAALVGPRRQERLNIQVRVQLTLRDDDPRAQVSIQGHQVGHLSDRQTEALNRIVRYGKRSVHETFECAAVIHGIAGQLGIRLDLPLSED